MGVSTKKIKGFTLLELIVVIAIIGILMGILSFLINGFMKNSQIETNNAKAEIVYTAFQDVLTQCEIKQDKSIFEVFPDHGNNLKGVVLFFRIAHKQAMIPFITMQILTYAHEALLIRM